MRLAKYLAHAGVASRRASEELDHEPARVTVDGHTVTDPATDVDGTERIAVDGEPIHRRTRVVYMLNKPKGVVSTASDTHNRPTVVSLIGSSKRLYPVGRLDADTTGLILLTNDGELANRLTHPRYEVPKTYRAHGRRAPVKRGSAEATARGDRARRRPHGARQGPAASPATSSRSPSTKAASARSGGCSRRSATRSIELEADRSSARCELEGLEQGDHRRLTPAEVERPLEESAPVKLRALRGAITVEANDAKAILERYRGAAARDGRPQRARARRHRVLPVHLHAGPERRVPGGRRAPDRPERRPAHVRPGDGRLRPAAARHPRDDALLRAAPSARPSTSTCATRPSCASTSRARSDGLEFARTLRDIPVYPAASTYEFDGDLTKLARNETPWEPHPAVIEAIAQATPQPQPLPRPERARKLRKALSDRYDVPPSKITLGNGSCEILLAAATAMLEPGAEIVYAWPSFSMYPHLAAMTGARAIEVPLDDDDTPRPRRRWPAR